VRSAADEALATGPLCGEPVAGVILTLTDVKLHSDSPHRSPAQVLSLLPNGGTLTALLRPPS
jgi:translation elongation factor EF-G